MGTAGTSDYIVGFGREGEGSPVRVDGEAEGSGGLGGQEDGPLLPLLQQLHPRVH